MLIADLSPLIIHDCADEACRLPIGALPAGTPLLLGFHDNSGRVLDAELLLWSDDAHSEYETACDDGRWFAKLTAPETPAAMFYCFRLHLAEGLLWLCAGEGGRFGNLQSSRGEGFRLTVYLPDFKTPAWFRRSVMYQIFPDRFARDDSGTAERGAEYHRALGRRVKLHESWDEPVDWRPAADGQFYFPDDFFGGTLRGIESKLDYLRGLGVGVIYLNPIFEACSNHRYDTADYMRIDPMLGTEEDFRSLCEKAKELGMRIMLDGVFSHTGADSRYFDRFSRYGGGACSGAESLYYGWYDFRRFPDDYRCWWGFEDLPEVDEENAAWQDFVIRGGDSVLKSWLARGASGWRLDVADELPDDVLSLIRGSAKEQDPDAVVLGEVWEDCVLKTAYGKRRDYALGYSLDSVMNYPLRTALLDFFCFRSDARALCAFLLDQRLNYPPPLYYSLMNLLGSHDSERLRTALATRIDSKSLTREQQAGFLVSESQDARGAAMQKLCAALQFSLPGVPCVYYGDELGMGGMHDPFCRAPLTEGRRPLYSWYAALGRVRNACPALSTGSAAFTAPDADVLCVLRHTSGGRDVFGEASPDGAYLCCVNRAGYTKRVVADIWTANAGLSGAELESVKAGGYTRGECLLTGETALLRDGLAELILPPESARIIRLT